MRVFRHHQEKSADWDRVSRELQLNEGDTWPFLAGYPEKTNTGGHVFFQLNATGTHIEMIGAIGDSTPLSFSIMYIDGEGKLWRTAGYVTDVLDENGCPAWMEAPTKRVIPYNNVVAWATSPPR